MSLSLLEHLDVLEPEVAHAGRIAFFLDYDGTLAPIVDEPDKAGLPSETREVLEQLAALENAWVSVISGRPVEDLRERVGLDIVYAGNHGLEIYGRGLEFREPAAEARRARLGMLADRLATCLQHLSGIDVEYKGLSATVHLRHAKAEARAEAERLVRWIAEREAELFRLRDGRESIEILPRVRWHKGCAALWIHRVSGGLPVCAGDDWLDEDLFMSVPDAITVHVGCNSATAADYYVGDPREMGVFLCWVRGRLTARGSPRRPARSRSKSKSAHTWA